MKLCLLIRHFEKIYLKNKVIKSNHFKNLTKPPFLRTSQSRDGDQLRYFLELASDYQIIGKSLYAVLYPFWGLIMLFSADVIQPKIQL